MSDKIRFIIRKALHENYPAGSQHDPNAPWNQKDQRTTPQKTGHSLHKIEVNESEWIVKTAGRYYVIDKEMILANKQLKEYILDTYAEVPYETEPDGEGGESMLRDYENVELDDEMILMAAEDAIESGNINSAEDYSNANGLVFELTPELAEAIWSIDSELESHPIVQRVMNYGEIRRKYPQSFER